MIKHDMKKARDIWREKIRKARKLKLEEQDIRYMRALEADSDVSSIVKIKEELRKFPNKPEIDAAETVEELREIWDNDLLGEIE